MCCSGVAVQFQEPAYEMFEGEGFVTVCAELMGLLEREVTVQLTIEDNPGQYPQPGLGVFSHMTMWIWSRRHGFSTLVHWSELLIIN